MRTAWIWIGALLLGLSSLSLPVSPTARCPVGAHVVLASQDEASAIEAAMLDAVWNCGDVSENAYALIPDFFFEDDPDGVVEALNVWDRECGNTEVLQRTWILAAIWMGDPVEDVYGESIVEYLLEFYEVHEQKTLAWPDGRPSGELLPFDPDTDPSRADYDAFTVSLAEQLLPFTEPGTLEHFFARFYAGEVSALASLRESTPAETTLRRSYDAELKRLSFAWEHFWAAHAGLWTPRQGLASVGSHPTLGFTMGVRRKRVLLRASGEIRILPATQRYLVEYEGELVESRAFNALYLGVEPGVTVWRHSRWELDVLAGLGWTGTAAVEGDPEVEGSARWIHSADLSVGLGLWVKLGDPRHNLLGFEVRYGHLDFDTGEGGDELAGPAWSVRMSFGFLGSRERARRDRALRGSMEERKQ